MSNNKFSFASIYCSHAKPKNHHIFIATDANTILSDMDLPLVRLIFTEIT